ncbi:hypothetical protein FEF26_14775 [Nesterenkonia salmonea]|uniref:Uncharacterized protein n=1 Tax=Nesterenkonia salmonea TaxID=1804987 RepID=A0A5R9B715_9MICC|nr:hypothetical protein [Nesterenkonia salmonea]TLP92374.1 hypothetical protein FEF26_14775 [Nesterenkonia salmonea]
MNQQQYDAERIGGALTEADLSAGLLRFDASKVSQEELQLLTAHVTDSADVRHFLDVTVRGSTIHFDAMPSVSPITRLELRADDTEILRLSGLFFPTDRAFEGGFKSRSTRPDDAQLDFFIASQMFEHFEGQPGYRISCAVICGYKAAELQDPVKQEHAERMLLRSLLLLPTTSLATSTRLDREHLHVSVLCALWHVYLAAGKPSEFVQTLQSLRALVEDRSFASFFQLAYNVSLSLRVLALVRLMRKDVQDAQDISELSREIFQLSVRDSTTNLNHFKEIGYTHTHVLETMRLARRTKTLTENTIDKTLTASLRVKSDRHPKAFASMKATFEEAATRT